MRYPVELSSRANLWLKDLLGSVAFSPVKKDMLGNVEVSSTSLPYPAQSPPNPNATFSVLTPGFV